MLIFVSLLGVSFFVYFTFVSSIEVCGCPYRLLAEPFAGSCQICDSDKIRDTVENLYGLLNSRCKGFGVVKLCSGRLYLYIFQRFLSLCFKGKA